MFVSLNHRCAKIPEKNLNGRCLLNTGNATTEGVLSGRCAKEKKKNVR